MADFVRYIADMNIGDLGGQQARASLQLLSSEIIYEFMGWQCRFEDHSQMPSKCQKRGKLELMII
ncbi:hypothetical protein NC651_005986 [Populus alba x Populus x berolinensis]|nr:hypothetical protein NC651_005986 [Populus alba x Populus x berolinensis]